MEAELIENIVSYTIDGHGPYEMKISSERLPVAINNWSNGDGRIKVVSVIKRKTLVTEVCFCHCIPEEIRNKNYCSCK